MSKIEARARGLTAEQIAAMEKRAADWSVADGHIRNDVEALAAEVRRLRERSVRAQCDNVKCTHDQPAKYCQGCCDDAIERLEAEIDTLKATTISGKAYETLNMAFQATCHQRDKFKRALKEIADHCWNPEGHAQDALRDGGP